MNIYDFYKDKIKDPQLVEDEVRGKCPFHNDTKMSFSANIKTGLWNCFAGCGGGDLILFYMKLTNCSRATARKKIKKLNIKVEKVEQKAKDKKLAIIGKSEIEKCHQQLLDDEETIDKLKVKRGISIDTIKKYKLGYDGDRIWIPVKEGIHYVNVRKYDIDKKYADEFKVVSYKIGHGELRLYPEENLKLKDLVLVEGEMDCLLSNQHGIPAITVTGGAGTFKNDFIKILKGKNIYIAYDNDKAGKDGAKKIYKKMARLAKVKIIALPVKNDKEDITDYFVKYGYTKDDFAKLMEEKKVEKIKPIHVSLDKASKDEFYFKDVEMEVVVSGKDLAPYFVPKKVKVFCNISQKKCQYCPLGEDGEMIVEFSNRDAELLSMINCSVDQQKGAIKKKAGIINCHACTIEILEVLNIEEARVIPEIDFSAYDREYVTRQIFSVGPGIYTNRAYQLTGITVPNPRNQYATQIIYDKKPIQDSMDHFKIDNKLIQKLKVFQPGKKQSIEDKLNEIHKDFTYNVTHIYHRDDILRAIDLVYHSVLKFKFINKSIIRGWTECLILGDTRSGKTETIQGMINHFKAGEMVTGENTSFAGLVGGMQQTQEKWSISWGKIPLNDRRLVAIDEASGLTVDHVSAMSGIRSSGVAEIVKIQTERTNARTRLIWLSNPRSGRKLDTYNHGIMAVKELMGRVEDVARLDFAVTAASGEVSQKEIHQSKPPNIKQKYTSELCNKLIMWAWSRSEDDVKFDKGAIDEILASSQFIGKRYSSTIPLVEPAEQRIKIARLSIALAARLFSTINGNDVIVKKEHVKFIENFLVSCYNKPSMGYDMYSTAQLKSEEMSKEQYEKIKAEFKHFANWDNVRDILLEYQVFRKGEFIDQIGYNNDDAKTLFQWFGRNRLIKSTSIGYVKHPAFTQFLKSIINDERNERNDF